MENTTDTDHPEDRYNDDAQLDHKAYRPVGEGILQFEDGTSQAFQHLVRQTLESSDFIDTNWVGESLVVMEV